MIRTERSFPRNLFNAQTWEPTGRSYRMIMLKEYLGPKEFQNALDLTQSFPELLFVHYTIKNALRTFPCYELRLFSYPFEYPIYWFTVIINKTTRPTIHIAQQGDNHDEVVFSTAVRLFLAELDLVGAAPKLTVSAEGHLIHHLSEHMLDFFGCEEPVSRLTHTIFYMSEEQMENCTKVDVALPYGFAFSKLQLNEAEQLIHDKEMDDSSSVIVDRIRHMPSVCIRETGSQNIVSHELVSTRGDMLNLYTEPDYRRQGLASAAEMRLAQKIIKKHNTPFKAVPNHLTSIILSSEESPFWNMWTRNTIPVRFCVWKYQKD